MFEINSVKKGKAKKRPASMPVEDDQAESMINKKKRKEAAPDLSTAFRAAFKHSIKHDVHKREDQNTKSTKKANKFQAPSPKEVQHSSSSTLQIGNHGRGLSQLQIKFQKKLEGARFRALNEKLYSANGAQSFTEFQEDPTLFKVYHEGYREQVKSWPVNPLDLIISWIKTEHPNAVVADLGCGDAVLSASVTNTVHSFDLVSSNSRVIACDISKLPLKSASVDITVFCLSLMGTNIADFLKEAHRILKPGGILKIAEVRSRFEGVKDGIKKFFRVLKKAGFDSTEKNFDNKMFFLSESLKSSRSPVFDSEYSARVCVYKKR